MNATYDEVLERLIEERKRLGLTQKEMACVVHMSQSNYSKVERSLHRLSFEEVTYLSNANIDILYVFTGYRCAGKHTEYFRKYSYGELCCYLGMIYCFVILKGHEINSEQWKIIMNRVRYVPLILGRKKSSNLFFILRHETCSRQKPMAEKLGVDVKKFRELEKDRCLPDSELIWKLYNLFHLSPAVVLKDKNSLINELSSLLEEIEENGIKLMEIIDRIPFARNSNVEK